MGGTLRAGAREARNVVDQMLARASSQSRLMALEPKASQTSSLFSLFLFIYLLLLYIFLFYIILYHIYITEYRLYCT